MRSRAGSIEWPSICRRIFALSYPLRAPIDFGVRCVVRVSLGALAEIARRRFNEMKKADVCTEGVVG